MKLAGILSLRKDLQKKIDQLSSRLRQNVKIQEGDEPAEQPGELLKVLDECLKQLKELILKINIINLKTERNGRTSIAVVVERDMLTKHIGILREAFNTATQTQDRYSHIETRYVSTTDIKALNRQTDHFSQELCRLDMQIQTTDFEVDLVQGRINDKRNSRVA